MKNIRNCHPRENDKEAEEKRNGKTKIEKEKKLSRNAQTSQPKDLTKNNKKSSDYKGQRTKRGREKNRKKDETRRRIKIIIKHSDTLSIKKEKSIRSRFSDYTRNLFD